MKTLDLELCGVKKLNTIELTTINGGFNQSAYNAGEKAGEFVRNCVDDWGWLTTAWKIVKVLAK